MTYRTTMTSVLLVVAASAFAADPGYLTVTTSSVKPGRTQEYDDYYKKTDAFLDDRGSSGRYVRLRRAYPIGTEHGYNHMTLSFRPEPPELDPAKAEPSTSLAEFLKVSGWTREQYRAALDSFREPGTLRGRMYREVTSIGAIQPGDWVRVNWIRASPGKRAAVREVNLKYLKVAAQKHIDSGAEKAWMFYELPFHTSEKDFDFFRVHVFADSKSAQRQFATPMSAMFPSNEWARFVDSSRGTTETTRVEIYQVVRSVTRK